MTRLPVRIAADTALNGIVSHADWFVTLLPEADVPDIADKLRAGWDLCGPPRGCTSTGDQLAYVSGESAESQRIEGSVSGWRVGLAPARPPTVDVSGNGP